jgi:hypothetical protein
MIATVAVCELPLDGAVAIEAPEGDADRPNPTSPAVSLGET